MIHLDRATLRAMKETVAWVAGKRRRVKVVGASMEPTLLEGDFVLVDESQIPQAGDPALARHPDRDLLVVKRVESVTDDGSFVLASDNPTAGTDSRTWGPLPAKAVLGTVTLVLGDANRSLDPPTGEK